MPIKRLQFKLPQFGENAQKDAKHNKSRHRSPYKIQPFPGNTKNVTALQHRLPAVPGHFFVFKHTKSQPLRSDRSRYKTLLETTCYSILLKNNPPKRQ